MSFVTREQEAIVANADRHDQLLNSIASLDYVTSALAQHSAYTGDLQGQLVTSERRVEALAAATRKEKEEHEDIRNSTTRRFAAKLTGRKEKFEAKEAKEEREYVTALQNETVERDRRNMLHQLLTEALKVKSALEEKAKHHQSLKAELDSLYSRVFDGISRSYPGEDILERAVVDVSKQHEKLQQALNIESQAADLLCRASALMDQCQKAIAEAEMYSNFDMYGGNKSSMADFMERNALTNAEACSTQAEGLMLQASRISPKVQLYERVQIPAGSMVSDILFDNYFSDRAFHKKILAAKEQVIAANVKLASERDAAIRRRDEAGRAVMTVSHQLDAKRKELHALRRSIFESITRGNGAGQRPTRSTSGDKPGNLSLKMPAAHNTLPSYSDSHAGAPGTPWSANNPYAADFASHSNALANGRW